VNPLLVVIILSALPASAQQPSSSTAPQAPAAQNQQQPPAQGGSDRSVIKPVPGQQALKEKDFYDRTGTLHPFRRMPRFVLVDQEKIWTSPVRSSKRDIKWWALGAITTGGLIASDRYIERHVPGNSTWLRVGNDASYLGEAYTLLPIAAGMYFIGTAKGSEHFRETGLLSFEAIADVTVVQLALKGILGRERPPEGNHNGAFEQSTDRINSSFPSGHTITTFAMASVVAHEYHHHWWVKALIYGYGAGVATARVIAERHFPGDVVGGGLMGWFIGDYVYGKRHNPQVDKPSVAQTIFSHISLGGGI
jgi:membrane-associated phospholipid phosphatase